MTATPPEDTSKVGPSLAPPLMGVDKLHARDAHRSINDMGQTELVVLCEEMDLAVDPAWGPDRLRTIIRESTFEL